MKWQRPQRDRDRESAWLVFWTLAAVAGVLLVVLVNGVGR